MGKVNSPDKPPQQDPIGVDAGRAWLFHSLIAVENDWAEPTTQGAPAAVGSLFAYGPATRTVPILRWHDDGPVKVILESGSLDAPWGRWRVGRGEGFRGEALWWSVSGRSSATL